MNIPEYSDSDISFCALFVVFRFPSSRFFKFFQNEILEKRLKLVELQRLQHLQQMTKILGTFKNASSTCADDAIAIEVADCTCTHDSLCLNEMSK